MKIHQCKVCNTPMINTLSFSEHEKICSEKCLGIRKEMMKIDISETVVRHIYSLKKAKKIKKYIKTFAKANNYKKKFVADIVYERGFEMGLTLIEE